MTPPAPRVLVGGVGNVLRADDGFGVAVIHALDRTRLPDGVVTLEVGIGGIGILHELLGGPWAGLILLDASDRQRPPGTLFVLEPEVPAPVAEEERLSPTDLHEVVPGRILVLARALGVLPPVVRLVCCQPADTDSLALELTPAVAAAVPRAVTTVGALAREIQRGAGRAIAGGARGGGALP